MLTQEQKNKLIDARLQDYDLKIYNLELDAVAFASAGHQAGVDGVRTRIERLQTARAEIEKLKVTADADA